MKMLLDSVTKILNESIEDEQFTINKKNYFIKKEFSQISSTNDNKKEKICFVDGGNSEILGSTFFSLNFNKICKVFFREKQSSFEVDSFFSLSKKLGKRISIETDPLKEFENITEDVSCYDACCLVRSCSELSSGLDIDCDILVVDGSFDTNSYSLKYFNALKESCLKKNIVLLGISKTNGFITNKGRPLSFVLSKMSENVVAPWFYELNETEIYEDFCTCFVKFHSKSEYVLRVDFLSEQKSELKKALSTLINNCSDPVFFGYPYGLIKADDLARVSNQEISELRAEALAKLDKHRSLVEDVLKSKDAHSVLDKMKF